MGVSEEAALDQRTVPPCLSGVERCRRLSPRPSFVAILGDRYGWRPLPFALTGPQWEQATGRVVDRWETGSGGGLVAGRA